MSDQAMGDQVMSDQVMGDQVMSCNEPVFDAHQLSFSPHYLGCRTKELRG